MIFYEGKLKYTPGSEMPFDGTDMGNNLSVDKAAEHPKHDWIEKIRDLNRDMGSRCGLDGHVSVYFYGAKEGNLDMLMACEIEKVSLEESLDFVRSYMDENYYISDISISDVKEISVETFHKLGERGDSSDFIRHWPSDVSDIDCDYLNNNQYKLKEYICSTSKLSHKEAVKRATRIMADKTFLEELERIYDPINEKKYYGNPVHYKVAASNSDAAMDVVNILVPALYENKRILSRRISRVTDIDEGCYDESDFEHLIKNAQGGAVVIELMGSDEDHGNYASSYQRVVDYIYSLVKKYYLNTLFIFAENTEHPGFTKTMISKVQDDLDVIEIKEGYGEKKYALDYLEALTKDNGYEVTRKEMEEMLPDKKMFSVGEIYDVYKKWFKNGLRSRFYQSYKTCSAYRVENEKKDSEPYKELMSMVGLNDIKRVVDEIIDTNKVQSMRSKMGLDTYGMSRHMIFTGNPGSAKTTVARLLAQILRKEGVLDSGVYVECGRADLVGKFVGWTAPTVKEKFKQARGGVLFIDEAYSLVDDRAGLYGDEAINTIVQEMENHRDDVIVIFAGYPEKMKAFLDRNEGLRSRIAFHLDFPDYTPDEMVDILKLMIDKKGYSYSDDVVTRCREIFDGACSEAEFGNGRFARNLLEQAEMAQSKRVIRENKGKKISKKALLTLKAEDFDVNAAKNLKETKKRTMGFAV